jgi:hypothetical protein
MAQLPHAEFPRLCLLSEYTKDCSVWRRHLHGFTCFSEILEGRQLEYYNQDLEELVWEVCFKFLFGIFVKCALVLMHWVHTRGQAVTAACISLLPPWWHLCLVLFAIPRSEDDACLYVGSMPMGSRRIAPKPAFLFPFIFGNKLVSCTLVDIDFFWRMWLCCLVIG